MSVPACADARIDILGEVAFTGDASQASAERDDDE